MKWVEIDAQYDTYLFNDIKELRAKLKEQESTERECRKAAVLLDHQIKGVLGFGLFKKILKSPLEYFYVLGKA